MLSHSQVLSLEIQQAVHEDSSLHIQKLLVSVKLLKIHSILCYPAERRMESGWENSRYFGVSKKKRGRKSLAKWLGGDDVYSVGSERSRGWIWSVNWLSTSHERTSCRKEDFYSLYVKQNALIADFHQHSRQSSRRKSKIKKKERRRQQKCCPIHSCCCCMLCRILIWRLDRRRRAKKALGW